MKPRTVETLSRVAAIYLDAPRTGRHPVDEVARRLGITYQAAKQRIRRARRAGLLAPEVFDIGG